MVRRAADRLPSRPVATSRSATAGSGAPTRAVGASRRGRAAARAGPHEQTAPRRQRGAHPGGGRLLEGRGEGRLVEPGELALPEQRPARRLDPGRLLLTVYERRHLLREPAL